jgi:GDPmannose 4,6-dehydratase
MPRRALITGISGQDGSYLSQLLLEKGYDVHGFVLRSELENPARDLWRLKDFIQDVHLYPASVESYPAMFAVTKDLEPDECYHLAARSFVSYTFDDDFITFDTNVNGTLNILSILHQAAPACRFYFAGSSELFGRAPHAPQNEATPFNPRSVYGITKATGYYLTGNYRETYGMFACSGILYNHESPRRGFEYVTRKITLGAARISMGLADSLHLGNLDAVRDWGFAGDYVQAMWMILQNDCPVDYVIASGVTHSVREFCQATFSRLGLDYRDYVVQDEKYYRPAEEVPLVGDASRARAELGWQPKVGFRELVEMMVDADVEMLRSENNL